MRRSRSLRSHLHIAIAFALLLLSAGSAVWSAWQRQNAEMLVRHSFDVDLEVEKLRINTALVEINRRGYVMSGRQIDLTRFRQRLGMVFDKLDNLSRLVADNPAQRARVARLRIDAAAWLANREESIELRHTGQIAAAQAAVSGLPSARTTATMLQTLKGINDAELNLLAERERHAGQLERLGQLTLLVSLILVFGLAALVGSDRRRQLRALQDAHDRLEHDVNLRAIEQARREEHQARFRLLTEQASDMISLHDATGRCLFMSPSSKAVLGHDPDDMIGKDPQEFILPEDHHLFEQHRADMATNVSGEVCHARFRMRRHDGSAVWMDIAARIADYRGEPRIITVSRDVSEQVAAERELRNARLQAEAAVKAKASFLANMSHEIRTPMNGVIGFTELLLGGTLSDEQRQQVETIADSGRAMMHLLNDILDLSKVEAGQMMISEQPFDLLHLLQACIKLVTPAVTQRGLALHCELAPDLPRRVCGDALRLRQILLNLMGNAAKFTVEGSVTLRAGRQRDGEGIVIEIADTGIGIAPERQGAIFEHFVQADSVTTARFGGSGLGLAISTQLAELMGGDLRLSSELGQGTSFFLTLPLPAVVDVERAPVLAVPVARAPAAGLRVLVAEDVVINQRLIAAMLARLGHHADIAEDGRRAVEMVADAQARGRPYSIVLMDMQMPVMSGLDAARHLRTDGFDAVRLPILALTANAFAEDAIASREAGMQAHLTKPLVLHDLEGALRQWAVPPDPATAEPLPIAS